MKYAQCILAVVVVFCSGVIGYEVVRTPKLLSRDGIGNETELLQPRLSKRQPGQWKKESQPSVPGQGDAPWNLARISEGPGRHDVDKDEVLDGTYYYENNAGLGVDLFIIDAPFSPRRDPDHPEFGIRGGFLNTEHYSHPGLMLPSSKHGLWMASVAAGKTYGVAKGASVYSIPMETYSLESIVQGMKRVLVEHKRNIASRTFGFRGSVINIGKGVYIYGEPDFEDALVQEAIDVAKSLDEAGVLVVSSIGNRPLSVGSAKSHLFPCQLPGVVCVGGVDKAYSPDLGLENAEWATTHGSPLFMWAPSDHIPYAHDLLDGPDGPGSQGALQSVSGGTSFAAAQVSGAAAIYLGYEGAYDRRIMSTTFLVREFLALNGKQGELNLGNLIYPCRNLLLNTGIQLVPEDSPKPFKDPSGSNVITSLLELEIAHMETFPVTKPPPATGEAQCFENPEQRIKWIIAKGLFLRLLWERGHVNQYNPLGPRHAEYPYSAGYDPPIPCLGLACVYLYREDKARESIQDTIDLSGLIDHIAYECQYYMMDENGNEVKDLSGERITDIGGRMEVPDHPGLYISIGHGVPNG